MKEVLVEEKKPHLFITFNSPERKNAFTLETLRFIKNTLEDYKDKDIIVVIKGSNGAFSSGADLKHLASLKSPERAMHFATEMEGFMDYLLMYPKPVIALVNGFSFGGGFGFALSSDIRIMLSKTFVAITPLRLGAYFPIGCTYRLIEFVGFGRAKDMILTGRKVFGDEAYRIGLVDYVVEDEDQMMEKLEFVTKEILQGDIKAYAYQKRVINLEFLSRINLIGHFNPELFGYLYQVLDWEEKINKFFEKLKKSK